MGAGSIFGIGADCLYWCRPIGIAGWEPALIMVFVLSVKRILDVKLFQAGLSKRTLDVKLVPTSLALSLVVKRLISREKS